MKLLTMEQKRYLLKVLQAGEFNAEELAKVLNVEIVRIVFSEEDKGL